MPSHEADMPSQSFTIVDNITGVEGEATGLIVVQQRNRMYEATSSLLEAVDILDKTGDPNLGLIPIFTDEYYISLGGVNIITQLQDYIRAIGTFGSSQKGNLLPANSHMRMVLPWLVNADQTPMAVLKEPRLPFLHRNRDRLTRRLAPFHHEVGKVAITGNRFVISLPDNVF